MPVPEEIETNAFLKYREQYKAAYEEIKKLPNDQEALFNGLNCLKALINEVYDALDKRIKNLEKEKS